MLFRSDPMDEVEFLVAIIDEVLVPEFKSSRHSSNLEGASLRYPNQLVNKPNSSGGHSVWPGKAPGRAIRSLAVKNDFLLSDVAIVRRS